MRMRPPSLRVCRWIWPMPGKYHTADPGRELRPQSPRAGANAAAAPQRNSRTTHCLCLITPPIYVDLTPQSDLVGPRTGDGVQTVAGLGYGGSYREACPTMVPLWRNARS